MEGGGQVLRCSSALAAVTGRPLSIYRIRGKVRGGALPVLLLFAAGATPYCRPFPSVASVKRSKPGLATQHLHGLRLVAQMVGAKIEGDALRSSEVTLEPGNVGPRAETYETVLDTAGSVALVLQAALPCAILAGHDVAIAVTGGTDVPFSPPMDFVLHVLEPTLRRCGVRLSHDLHRRGYMPAGGGRVVAQVEARDGPLPAFKLTERGEVDSVHVVVTGAGAFAGDFVTTAASHALTQARERLGLRSVREETTQTSVPPGQGNGASVLVVARTTTGVLLSGGARVEGKKVRRDAARSAAKRAVEALGKELAHGGAVCQHLQDQLIVYMAVAAGQSRVRTGPLSLHTCTAMSVAASVCGASFRVRAVGEGGALAPEAASLERVRGEPSAFGSGQWVVECDGIGLAPRKAVPT